MVEAAGIEPSQEGDTSDALSEQELHETIAGKEIADDLINAFRTDPIQNDNTFLRFVCEIYVKWTELPLTVRSVIENWSSLPRDTIELFEKIAYEVHSRSNEVDSSRNEIAQNVAPTPDPD